MSASGFLRRRPSFRGWPFATTIGGLPIRANAHGRCPGGRARTAGEEPLRSGMRMLLKVGRRACRCVDKHFTISLEFPSARRDEESCIDAVSLAPLSRLSAWRFGRMEHPLRVTQTG